MDYCRLLAGPTTWSGLMQQWKYSPCVDTGHPVFFCVAVELMADDVQRTFKTSQLQADRHRAECFLPCPKIPTQGKKQKTKGEIPPFPLKHGKPSFTLPPL